MLLEKLVSPHCPISGTNRLGWRPSLLTTDVKNLGTKETPKHACCHGQVPALDPIRLGVQLSNEEAGRMEIDRGDQHFLGQLLGQEFRRSTGPILFPDSLV